MVITGATTLSLFKILTLIFDFIVLFCCIFAFVLYFMYVVIASCFVYVAMLCNISK